MSTQRNILLGTPITPPISVTTADIDNNYNLFLASVKTPENIQVLSDLQKKQKENELLLIADRAPCSGADLANLRDHIPGLNAILLKDYTVNQLYNPAVMNTTACAMDSILYTSPYDMGSLYLNNRIRTYIHNLRQIGAPSVEGYVMVGDFENAKDMVIVKSPKDPTNDLLLHEMVVGLYGTNKLRPYIPNFSYVYGGFKCSPPMIDPDTKKVVTWCLHNDNAVNYILYENVLNSVNASKFIETCTGKEFLNMYMQILYALRLALKMIDFTHYDLHYNNVLLRNIHGNSIRPYQIMYETERGTEYITATKIATIIDYGFSHIKTNLKGDKVDRVSLGRSGYVPFSIFPYRSWIMHDLYKLLMFCLMGAMRHNNTSVITEITKIFTFFNSVESPTKVVEAQAVIYFSFPLTNTTTNLTIDDLASHIRLVCDCNFISTERSSDPLLDCEKLCPTSNKILSDVGMNPDGRVSIPDNVIEFYDLGTRLQAQNRTQELAYIAKGFRYHQCMQEHINKMTNMIYDIQQSQKKLKLIDIGSMTLDQVLTYQTMNTIRAMYTSVASIVDETLTLRFYYELGLAVAKSYQDNEAVKTLNGIVNEFETKVRPELEDAKRILGMNHNYLNRIRSDDIVKVALQRDTRLQWYWNGRELFDIVFGRDIVYEQIFV